MGLAISASLAVFAAASDSQQNLFWQADQDILTFDLYRISLDVLTCGTTQYFACTHVELRAMPWAGQHVAIEFALAEWAADMSAGIGEGTDDTTRSGQTDWLTIDLYRHKFAFFYVAEFCYLYRI